MPQHDLLKHTENEIRTIFEVNVLAHFWMFEAFLPKMIANNKGHIVALSSMAGILGLRNLVPYCGSKFAVRGIQESLSEELRTSTKGQSKVEFKILLSLKLSSTFIYIEIPDISSKIILQYRQLLVTEVLKLINELYQFFHNYR